MCSRVLQVDSMAVPATVQTRAGIQEEGVHIHDVLLEEVISLSRDIAYWMHSMFWLKSLLQLLVSLHPLLSPVSGQLGPSGPNCAGK